MEISRREFVSLVTSGAAALASPALLAQAVRVRREIRTLSASGVTALANGIAAMKTQTSPPLGLERHQGVHRQRRRRPPCLSEAGDALCSQRNSGASRRASDAPSQGY